MKAPTPAQLRILRFLRDNPDAYAYVSKSGGQSWCNIHSYAAPTPSVARKTLDALEKGGWVDQLVVSWHRTEYRLNTTGRIVAGDAPYDDGKKDRLKWRGYEVDTFTRGYPEVKPVAVVSDIRADGDYSLQYQHDYEKGRDSEHRRHPDYLHRTRAAAALHAARIHRSREAEHRRLAEELEGQSLEDEPDWTEGE